MSKKGGSSGGYKDDKGGNGGRYNLKHLGASADNGGGAGLGVKYQEPSASILEVVNNPHGDVDYSIRFTCPEFTSICPVTGQPDFAHIVMDYIPGKLIVESKSLKLYLHSYRNHGAFHEDCTISIARDLTKLLNPKWLRIGGYWYPRGGIPIDIFYQSGEVPKGVWVKDQNVADYRGRG